MGYITSKWTGYGHQTNYYIGENIQFKTSVRDKDGRLMLWEPLTAEQCDELADGKTVKLKFKEKIGYSEYTFVLKDFEVEGHSYKGIAIQHQTIIQTKPRHSITAKKALKLFPEIAEIPIFQQAISLENSEYQVQFVYCEEDNILDFVATIPYKDKNGRNRPYHYPQCYFRVRGNAVTIHFPEKQRVTGTTYYIGDMLFNDKNINSSVEDILQEFKELCERYSPANIEYGLKEFNFMDAIDYIYSEVGCGRNIDALFRHFSIDKIEEGSLEEYLLSRPCPLYFRPKNYIVQRIWGNQDVIKIMDYEFRLPQEYKRLRYNPAFLELYINYILKELKIDEGIKIVDK